MVWVRSQNIVADDSEVRLGVGVGPGEIIVGRVNQVREKDEGGEEAKSPSAGGETDRNQESQGNCVEDRKMRKEIEKPMGAPELSQKGGDPAAEYDGAKGDTE